MATIKVSALTPLAEGGIDGTQKLLTSYGSESFYMTLADANKKLYGFLDVNGNYIQLLIDNSPYSLMVH